jgi:hypothetical protein
MLAFEEGLCCMELISFLFDSLFDEEYDVPKLYPCLLLPSDFTRLRNAAHPYTANSEGP